MANETAPETSEPPSAPEAKPASSLSAKPTKIKPTSGKPPWLTLLTLAFAVGMFSFYVVADRLAPYTDIARVRAYVVPIIPEVAGTIIDVQVEQDAIVEAGTSLFRIEDTDYAFAVKSATAQLEQITQDVNAEEAGVESAVAKLSEARSNLKNVRQQSGRVFTLTEKKLLPAAQADEAQAALDAAIAKVNTAQAELTRTREQLGATGAENARIEQAVVALEKAQLDLSRTSVAAPSFGVITNLNIDEGYFARPGQPVMTFIAAGNIWIEAAFRENSLGHVEPGQTVSLCLDIAPGKVFKGEVASIGYGVKQGQDTSLGVLPQIKGNSGWLRDAQRFPVLIKVDDQGSLMSLLRVGGQVDVTIFTGDHPIINRLSALRMTLVSWMSFVY